MMELNGLEGFKSLEHSMENNETGRRAAAMADPKTRFMISPFKVCVDLMDVEQISGRVYSQSLRSPVAFRDIADLLMQLDELFDQRNFPKAFQRARTFSEDKAVPAAEQGKSEPESDYMTADLVESMKGDAATFLISVSTRQNSTWQGWLDWMDGSPHRPFNSALELIRLIDKGRRML
jgi:hypothetical protein